MASQNVGCFLRLSDRRILSTKSHVKIQRNPTSSHAFLLPLIALGKRLSGTRHKSHNSNRTPRSQNVFFFLIQLLFICLLTEHLGVLKNSLKRVREFQIELEFGNVGFFFLRRKPEYPEKNLSEQRREPPTKSTHIWR